MKILIFHHGLGNQLFHYAKYMYMKKVLRQTVFWAYLYPDHNGLEINKYFNVEIEEPSSFSKFFFKFLMKCYYNGIKFLYYSEQKDKKESWYNVILVGDWQNKRYFTGEMPSFRDLPLSDRNQEIADMMNTEGCVAIHIRRGDFLNSKNDNKYIKLCETAYYDEAISIISKKVNNPIFFFFSDDINWVKENYNFPNAYYIDWNKGNDSIYDMYLMSKASAIIIANSTFSFWAAKLSNAKIVIYPNRWFTDSYIDKEPDIFPDEWIGI